MKKLDKIVFHLLDTLVGGQKFFSALDKSIQHKEIVDKLFDISTKNNIYIVSGGFGKFIKTNYPEKEIILLEGGLRHLSRIDLKIIEDNIKHKDFVFLDDSYFNGKTRNVIREAVEKLKGNVKHTYVVYDGSKIKDKDVTSLFRYHERF